MRGIVIRLLRWRDLDKGTTVLFLKAFMRRGQEYMRYNSSLSPEKNTLAQQSAYALSYAKRIHGRRVCGRGRSQILPSFPAAFCSPVPPDPIFVQKASQGMQTANKKAMAI